MRSGAQGNVLRRHYDRLIALVLCLLLGGLLAYLGIEMGRLGAESTRFVEDLDFMKPLHLKAEPVNLRPYEQAETHIREPLQVTNWTTQLIVPETRVWCLGCLLPIPITANMCPFCKSPQPVEPELDSDGDKIPDEWEIANRLDPRDPADAAGDPDKDGFSNFEEYLANPQTDPNDATNSPSVASKLYVEKIESQPFQLLFKSLVKMPDGSWRFGINTRRDAKTYVVSTNDTVEGFLVLKFELRVVELYVESVGKKQRVNKSVLTLSKGGKLIPLVYGEEVPIDDYTAVLIFSADNSRYSVRKDEVFRLGDREYKVLEIDSKATRVVVERTVDGMRLNIGPRPQ